jgi:spermidine synthase
LWLFLLSGASDLICEIAWGRALSLVFGVTAFVVSTVLASFMLGLAGGGLLMPRLARWEPRPLALFARLHAGISISVLATLPLLPAVRGVYVAASGVLGRSPWLLHPTMILLSVLLIIAPAALMGATFPVASQVLASRPDQVGRDVGLLYSAGTLGSVAGCVVAVGLLLPVAGLQGTLVAVALLDLAIAAVAAGTGRVLARK